jgi:hypothetical protein
MGFFFFLINGGGQQTASENRPFTMTSDPRRLRKPHWLIGFVRLGKDYCSSVCLKKIDRIKLLIIDQKEIA